MNQDERRFYVYAFLRSNDSPAGKKLSPYYIGKGQGDRAFSRWRRLVQRPEDTNYIVFIQEGLTENEAFCLEKFCIFVYGRIDTGTGILRNLTDGGEGACGLKHSIESKAKMSESRLGAGNAFWGQKHTKETREKIAKAKLGKKWSAKRRESFENRDPSYVNPLKGKTRLPETIAKLRGRKVTQETKNRMATLKAKYLYEFIDPHGEVYITENLNQFAKQYGLQQSALSLVAHGKATHHKRWTGHIVERLK
jgi:hypothetical protein